MQVSWAEADANAVSGRDFLSRYRGHTRPCGRAGGNSCCPRTGHAPGGRHRDGGTRASPSAALSPAGGTASSAVSRVLREVLAQFDGGSPDQNPAISRGTNRAFYPMDCSRRAGATGTRLRVRKGLKAATAQSGCKSRPRGSGLSERAARSTRLAWGLPLPARARDRARRPSLGDRGQMPRPGRAQPREARSHKRLPVRPTGDGAEPRRARTEGYPRASAFCSGKRRASAVTAPG